MNLVKSPVCSNKEELLDWFNETFPGQEGIIKQLSNQQYPLVFVCLQAGRGDYLGGSFVFYHEFQTARYVPVEDA